MCTPSPAPQATHGLWPWAAFSLLPGAELRPQSPPRPRPHRAVQPGRRGGALATLTTLTTPTTPPCLASAQGPGLGLSPCFPALRRARIPLLQIRSGSEDGVTVPACTRVRARARERERLAPRPERPLCAGRTQPPPHRLGFWFPSAHHGLGKHGTSFRQRKFPERRPVLHPEEGSWARRRPEVPDSPG